MIALHVRSISAASKFWRECDLVDIQKESFWRVMKVIGPCPLLPSKPRYVVEITPLKSRLIKKLSHKYNLQGGGPTIANLIEHLVSRDHLFILNAGDNAARTDDESDAMALNLTSDKELEIVKSKVMPIFSNPTKLENLIKEAQRLGILE
jgi:hypothetical protein